MAASSFPGYIGSPGVYDGWADDSAETWTYASGSGGGVATFTVLGDQTAKFSPGTRVKLTQTTVKFFVVIGSTVSAGVTTVTITAGTDYTLANAAISLNYYSYAANPQGWPDVFNWLPTVTGWVTSPTISARFSVTGRRCTIWLYIDGTSNSTANPTFTVPVSCSSVAVTLQIQPATITDNGVQYAGSVEIDPANPTTASAFKLPGSTATFTASGTKKVFLSTTYEI